MRYLPGPIPAPPSSQVSATVYAPGQSMVDVDLDGLKAIGHILNTVGLDALQAVRTVDSIGWNVPLGGDLLALSTAKAYSEDVVHLTVELGVLATRAGFLSGLVYLSAATYSHAEDQAVGNVAQLRLPLDLTMVAFQLAQSANTAAHTPGHPFLQEILDPADLGWILRTVADATGGSYRADMSQIDQAFTIFDGSAGPIVTKLAAGPNSGKTQPVASIASAIAKVDNLYENADTSAHIQVQQVVNPQTHLSSWLVILPGTSNWQANAKNPADLTGNLNSEAGRTSALETAAWDALAQAKKQAGDRDSSSPVMIVGHSQGGIVATNMARHAAAKNVNVTRIATFGSPTGGLPAPAKIAVLNVEQEEDMVPALDSLSTGDKDPNRTIVELHDPNSIVTSEGKIDRLKAHNPTQYGSDFATATANLPPSNAANTFINDSSQFFSPTAQAYVFDTTRVKPPKAPALSDRDPKDVR